jgi:hypothetical protein
MNAHWHTIADRLIRKALRSHCRYLIAAVGIDHRGRFIGIAHNAQRHETGMKRGSGWHAEERLMHESGRGLVRVLVVRVNRQGKVLPIDPCEKCRRMAEKRGVKIESVRAHT